MVYGHGGVEDLATAFVEAWNRHDMQALAALFTEDAHFVNVVGMWWKSRAEIEAAHAATHASIFKNSHLDARVAAKTPLGSGMTALHVTWRLTGQTQPDGTPSGPRRGILLLIASEAPDGWRIRVAQNTDIMPGILAPSSDEASIP
jgi:uncharacterized protein (TIGR02246 family)